MDEVMPCIKQNVQQRMRQVLIEGAGLPRMLGERWCLEHIGCSVA